MRASTILILLILISATVTGLYNFYFSMADEYGIDDEQSRAFEERYNKLDDIGEQINKTYSKTDNVGAGRPLEALQFFTGIWNVFSITKSVIGAIFSIPIHMVVDLTGTEYGIGLPEWFQTMMIAIITILVIVALLSILSSGRKW